MITNMGVNEFKVPAKALSIPSSAMQNKNAGNKLPSTPDKKIMPILFLGIFEMYLMVTGNKIKPENTILSAAT